MATVDGGRRVRGENAALLFVTALAFGAAAALASGCTVDSSSIEGKKCRVTTDCIKGYSCQCSPDGCVCTKDGTSNSAAALLQPEDEPRAVQTEAVEPRALGAAGGGPSERSLRPEVDPSVRFLRRLGLQID